MRFVALFTTIICALNLLAGADKANAGKLISIVDGTEVVCPLEHTAVQVAISGDIARVTLRQTYRNPLDQPLEAIYVFPMSHQAAVDRMQLVVGERRITGLVLERQKAKQVYQQAKAAGQTAALLEQERDNIFTQSVGNIPPQSQVIVQISYVEQVELDGAYYEYSFPMVVGPRYMPGSPLPTSSPATAQTDHDANDQLAHPAAIPAQVAEAKPQTPESGSGWAQPTNAVPDAHRISPPIIPPNMRSGHDISLSLELQAGMPIHDISVPSHKASWNQATAKQLQLQLDPRDSIPNKDFVLRWRVQGQQAAAGVLLHRPQEDKEGYLSLQVQPGTLQAAQDTMAKENRALPRDFCFLIDTSGSMSGAPLRQTQAVLNYFLSSMTSDDRLQIVSFAGNSQQVFNDFTPVNAESIAKAQDFNRNFRAGGGTEMMAGFRKALLNEPVAGRKRIVIVLSDGYIGNESEIIKLAIKKADEKTQFIGLGIGNSVNRMLFDGLAQSGGGLSKVLLLSDDPAIALEDMLSRLRKPQLSDISVDWGELSVSSQYPERISSLWQGRPLTLYGRFSGSGRQTIVISARDESGQTIRIPLTFTVPTVEPRHDSIASIWARQRIKQLQFNGHAGTLSHESVRAAIRQTALTYQLVSPYTSFVAVDTAVLEKALGRPLRMNVAVPLPDGVSSNAAGQEAFISPTTAPDLSTLDISVETLQLEDAVESPLIKGREEASAASETGGSGAFMALGAGGGAAGAYGNRTGGSKKRALAQYGGTRASESAVDRGLRFLARHQSPDGRWDVDGHPVNCDLPGPKVAPGAGRTGLDGDVLLTSEALLTFLAGGYDHRTPNKYRRTTASALSWLQKQINIEDLTGGQFDSHCAATMAIAESYALTNDPALRPIAQSAVDVLLQFERRHQDMGYYSSSAITGSRGETLTTLQAVMTLKSAQAAGLNIDDALQRAQKWLQAAWQAQNPDHELLNAETDRSQFPSSFDPQSGNAGPVTQVSSAEGLTLAIFLGITNSDALVQTLAAQVASDHPISLTRDTRLSYHITLGLFQTGGEIWTSWNDRARDTLIKAENNSDSCFDGSIAGTAESPAHILGWGSIMSTIWGKRCLQIYYRYIPMGRE